MFKKVVISFAQSGSPVNNYISVRFMSRVKTRYTMPPFWHPKKTRVLYPEDVTRENQEFIKEHIQERYSSPLKAEAYEPGVWKPFSYRCGLITKKLGVYPMWKKNGKRILTTLLHVSDNHVIKYIPPEVLKEHDHFYKRRVQNKDKLIGCLVVGAESADPRNFTKEYFNLFEKAGVLPKRRLTKFYITPNAVLPPGMQLNAAHFQPGDYVDCGGLTIDRGFQGVMKRWGFKGQDKTHGVTKSHRRGGSIGGGGGAKARVWAGTKMPGHMGRQRRILRGVEVVRVNTKHNIIYVRGKSIPGEIGKYVILYDSILHHKKRKESQKKFFPTYIPSPQEELPENLLLDDVHDFRIPSITFEEEKK